MGWIPLLAGTRRGEAESSWLEIAEALGTITLENKLDPSYSRGHVGLALFNGYLAKALDDERFFCKAEEHILKSADIIANHVVPVGLFNGLTGIAWAARHLCRLLESPTFDWDHGDIDEAVLELTRQRPWTLSLDLIYGLTGITCYALDHDDDSFKSEAATNIVSIFEEHAVNTSDGLTWHMKPTTNAALAPRECSHLRTDLGVAHGVAGIIAVLAEIYHQNFEKERVSHLLSNALKWMLDQRQPSHSSYFFPYYSNDTDLPHYKSAWCYGDIGVSFALLKAADATSDNNLKEEALAVAMKAANNPPTTMEKLDMSLCHGTACYGHLYNRLFQWTGRKAFACVSEDWFSRTLEMRRIHGEGIAGYSSWWPEEKTWKTEAGVLTGVAGIGLALLAATSSYEPGWDRPFLLQPLPV